MTMAWRIEPERRRGFYKVWSTVADAWMARSLSRAEVTEMFLERDRNDTLISLDKRFKEIERERKPKRKRGE